MAPFPIMFTMMNIFMFTPRLIIVLVEGIKEGSFILIIIGLIFLLITSVIQAAIFSSHIKKRITPPVIILTIINYFVFTPILVTEIYKSYEEGAVGLLFTLIFLLIIISGIQLSIIQPYTENSKESN